MRDRCCALILHLILAVMLAGCSGGSNSGASSAAGFGGLKVTVSEDATGSPVSGATVRIGDQAATTGADGTCLFATVPEGATAMAVTKGGYLAGLDSATIARDATTTQSMTVSRLEAPASYDVIVAGAGTGGVAAALQAARMGMRVALLEESDWIGGQMTAAAVTSLDEGSDIPKLRSGIYKEFVDKVSAHYWNLGKSTGTAYFNPQMIAFEPSVGQKKLYELLRETDNKAVNGRKPVLDLYLAAEVAGVVKEGDALKGVTLKDGTALQGAVVIDAGEYGDLLALAGARYRVGNSSSDGVDPSACTQFITYTAVIRKYLQGMDPLLLMQFPPPGYQDMAASFGKAVVNGGNFQPTTPVDFVYHNGWRGMPDSSNPVNYDVRPESMGLITKTGVNWFNDHAVTAQYVENKAHRSAVNCQAKLKTLQFLYYLQHDLGHAEWSVAKDEGFATPFNSGANSCAEIPQAFKALERQFPVKPYVREARRGIGIMTLTARDIKREGYPAIAVRRFPSSLAVGDYPVDLHGCTAAADLDCGETAEDIPPWGGGVFQVPFEVFVPELVDGLVLAEKNISVSRLVNGATRLQPITMMTGQAAGALAAVAVRRGVQPRLIKPVEVQWELLASGCVLSVYNPVDVPVSHPYWKQIQLALLYGIGGYAGESFDVNGAMRMSDLAYLLNEAFGTPVPVGNPDAAATRGDFAALLTVAMGLDLAGAPTAPAYADLPPSHPAFRQAQLLHKLGLLDGMPGNPAFFQPDQPISRGEISFLAVNAGLKTGASTMHRRPMATSDSQPPAGSVVINNGKNFTSSASVTLTLEAVDAGGPVTSVQFNKDGSSWLAWVPFAHSLKLTLPPGDGVKTVQVRFRDNAGNLSPIYSDAITLDSSPPTGSITINGGADTASGAAATLTLQAADLNGVEQMQFSKDGTTWYSWETFSTTRQATLDNGPGVNTVHVRFRDGAGNVSPVYSDAIVLAP